MSSPAPTMRADARRNRDKLLAAAALLFSREGTDVPLEAVAREAGVGVGTLYRHFPTRPALVEAVYRSEVDGLLAQADELLAEREPADALAAWMDRFVDYAETKRGLKAALLASSTNAFADTGPRITAAMARLLDAGVAAGTIRADLGAEDVLRAMGALWAMPDDDAWAERARRTVGLLMDGLRHVA